MDARKSGKIWEHVPKSFQFGKIFAHRANFEKISEQILQRPTNTIFKGVQIDSKRLRGQGQLKLSVFYLNLTR